MKARTLPASAAPASTRHRLVNQAALWRRSQVMTFYGAGVMLVGEGISYFGDHKLDPELLAFAVALALLGIFTHYGSRLHYVAVTEAGLRINRVLGFDVVPFDRIRQARTQQLRTLFASPSRQGKLQRSLRPFETAPACQVRVDLEPKAMARLGKALGRGCTIDQDLIILARDAKQLEQDLLPKLKKRPPQASRRR